MARIRLVNIGDYSVIDNENVFFELDKGQKVVYYKGPTPNKVIKMFYYAREAAIQGYCRLIQKKSNDLLSLSDQQPVVYEYIAIGTGKRWCPVKEVDIIK